MKRRKITRHCKCCGKLIENASKERKFCSVDCYQSFIRNKPLSGISIQASRNRMSKVKTTFTKVEWEECLEFFGCKCAYCGESSSETLCQEHFIPLSNKGPYTKNNIVPACRKCNTSKGSKDFMLWNFKSKRVSKERTEKILRYLGYI